MLTFVLVLQTIKDVNQALVDDGLVQTEKVGAGNFYWSFPSQSLNAVGNLLTCVGVISLGQITTKIDKTRQILEGLKAQDDILRAEVTALRASRCQSVSHTHSSQHVGSQCWWLGRAHKSTG